MSQFFISKHNCIFNHIPKTAGRSIRLGFFKREECISITPRPRHHNIFTFSFVRNPYDRLISAYTFCTINIPKEHRVKFSKFLNICADSSIPFQNSLKYNYLEFMRHHGLPQTHPFNYLEHTNFIGKYENLNQDWETLCHKIGIDHKVLPKINVSPKIKNKWYRNIYINFKNKFNQHTNYENKYIDSIGKDNIKTINEYWKEDFSELGYEKIEV